MTEQNSEVDKTIEIEANKTASGNPAIFGELEQARKKSQERRGGDDSPDGETETPEEPSEETSEASSVRTSLSLFETPAYEAPSSSVETEETTTRGGKKGGRGRAGLGGEPTKKNIFKKLLPPDQSLLVYWRNERGKYEFEDEFSYRDVTDAGSIEAFLKKTVGPGEYQLEIKDNKGEITKAGTIRIRAPREGDVAAMPHKQIYEMQRQMAEAAKKEGDEKVGLITELVKAVGGKEKDGGGVAAMIPILLMAMKPDPMQRYIDIMMMERMDRANQPPPTLPVPPAMAVPSGGNSEALELVKLMAELSKLNTPQQSNVSDALMGLLMETLRKNERTDIKDLLEVMTKSRDLLNPGSSDFNAQLRHYDQIQERLDRMSRRESDAGSIFSTLGESLASTVNAFRDLKMMNMQQMAQMGAGAAPGQTVTVLPQQENQNPQMGQMPPAAGNQPTIDPGSLPRPKAVPPLIPSGFRRFVIQMKKAFNEGDEKAVIHFFLDGLKFLFERGDQRWVSHIEKFVEKVTEGDQESALKFVYAFLRSFEANKLISEDLAETIYHSVEVYFDEIRATFQEETAAKEQAEAAPPPVEEKEGAEQAVQTEKEPETADNEAENEGGDGDDEEEE